MITLNAGRFKIWKVYLITGARTLVIEQANLATLFPTATNMSFYAFDVYGNVNTNAFILAANASTAVMEIYKLIITNG